MPPSLVRSRAKRGCYKFFSAESKAVPRPQRHIAVALLLLRLTASWRLTHGPVRERLPPLNYAPARLPLTMMRRCRWRCGTVKRLKSPGLGNTVTVTVYDLRIVNARGSQPWCGQNHEDERHPTLPHWRRTRPQ